MMMMMMVVNVKPWDSISFGAVTQKINFQIKIGLDEITRDEIK